MTPDDAVAQQLSVSGGSDYDPTAGRYVQRDPVGLLGGVNAYAYAWQNPIVLSDSSGQAAGDLRCEGFSGGGCQSGGSYGMTAIYCDSGRNVCLDCAAKLL
ncbi:hypothetical protein C0Z18_31140 [Trinickia dabaoshanensis]|uniref:RHS repeat-associated core domain-containing protein n=1 Tax=Trinickia dabaoshanensis TaxID=564714 RepID=A0A2N7VBP8_9BURK|nr:RHS repeat-associated core domain-containing protein [Trinickia dabaoshanensis]PMS14586.1 hypothetical protein C0Z18_31140 [Trinickia dabaoshanensis]